jgi:hypothetical protein
MPKWICPTCSASHNVPDSAIGRTAKCQKCGRPSIVTDSEEEIEPPSLLNKIIEDDDEGPIPARLSRKRSASYDAPPTIVAKGILLICLAIVVLAMLLSFITDEVKPLRGQLVLGTIIFGIQLALVWPFYGECDDIRAIREKIDSK